jgi:ABC-2 type transport system ATP-binding protein
MFVQIDAMGAEAGPTLASIPGVTRVLASEGSRGGFEVESERGTDIRRELARAIVNRGWGLLELRPMRMSLEEIFLQVTTDEAPHEAAGPTEEPEQSQAVTRE